MHLTAIYDCLPILWAGVFVCVVVFYSSHIVVYKTADVLKKLHFHEDHEELRKKYPWILGLATNLAHYPCLAIMYLSFIWIALTVVVTALCGLVWVKANCPVVGVIGLLLLSAISILISAYATAWKKAEKRRKKKKP